MENKALETATLAAGCFWCVEPIFDALIGVEDVASGYSGGRTENPTYQQVCSETTGHAEVVRIHFDPEIIQLKTLIDIFWAIHDPTTLNCQGADVGNDYRSLILYNSEEQKEVIRKSLQEVGTPLWQDVNPIVTEIKPLIKFYLGEPEHQDYQNNNPASGYCSVVINPKLIKFKKQFADLLED